MPASVFATLLGEDWVYSSWMFLPLVAFQVWMLVDAVRREEWIWAALILFFSFLTALFYYFLVYRQSQPAGPAFEIPGSHDRGRIKELQAQIHHLDKAHHHTELGNIYLRQGKLDKAEASYRAALERESGDLDTQACLGECLLKRGQAEQARTLLEQVFRANPKHDYGNTAMALAETLTALGENQAAIAVWESVLANHSYARARVQLAEQLLTLGQSDRPRQLLQDVVDDDAHSPRFERRRERDWVKRAKTRLARLS